MRRGEHSSRHGASAVLFLFLFGATLLLSVSVVMDVSAIIQISDASKDTISEPILREHRDQN